MEGRIVDPAGLPVPKAAVVLNNELTGSSEKRVTADDGLFTFADVDPGTYSLTPKAQGFAESSSRIEVESGRSVKMGDLALSMIGIDQSITVVSASRVEELQQDSAVNTLVVGREQIQNTGYERVADVSAKFRAS